MSDTAEVRRIYVAYIVSSALFTLATSVIWGVNTLFLLEAGLTLFQVFVVNAAFSAGDLVFQIPTGVVADTLGRKLSFMLSTVVLAIATLVYLGASAYGWGFWAFVAASTFLGLGFTFYGGAVDAWLIDALDAAGDVRPREQVFAWGGMTFSASMLVGTLAGGFLGQVDLALPYLVRTAALLLTLVVVALLMHDPAYKRRRLSASRFAEESRRVLRGGLAYGWRNPVVRPLFWISFVQGGFFIFGFYSWQPYFLSLLGRDAVWLAGVVASAMALMGILGNMAVGRVMRRADGTRRDAAKVLATTAALTGTAVVLGGVVGLVPGATGGGIVPFLTATAMYLAWGFVFGVSRPVRQGYLNRHIPADSRATILSVDMLFDDAGGTIAQPGLGFLAEAVSIPVAWVLGGIGILAAAPLYRASGRHQTPEAPLTEPVSEYRGGVAGG